MIQGLAFSLCDEYLGSQRPSSRVFLSSSPQKKEHETWVLKSLLHFPENKQPFTTLLAYICEHLPLWCCSGTVLTIYLALQLPPPLPDSNDDGKKTHKKTTEAFIETHVSRCRPFCISSLYRRSYLCDKGQISGQISFSSSESGPTCVPGAAHFFIAHGNSLMVPL